MKRDKWIIFKLRARLPRSFATLLSVLLLLPASRTGAFAASTDTLGFVGNLSSTSGGSTPFSGNVDILISFYDTESGGTSLRSECFKNTEVNSGRFGVRLGSVSSFSPSLGQFMQRNPSLYLELKVCDPTADASAGCAAGCDDPLTPRLAVNSTPLAAVASTLQGLTPDNLLQITGNSSPYLITKSALDTILGMNGAQDASTLHHHDSLYAKLGGFALNTGALLGLGTRTTDPVSLTSADAGKTWFDSAAKSVKYWDGSAVQTLGTAGSSGITAISGDVTASGTGSVAATVNSVGGVSAANVALGANVANSATAANTPGEIVKRDASGSFGAAGVILGADPTAAMNAATKQYVDTIISTRQANLGYTPVNRAGDTMTGGLNLATGNSVLAPLKFTAGPSLSSPVAGAIEFDGNDLFFTNNTPARQTIAAYSSSIAPASGQVLTWNGATWAPASTAGTGTVTSVSAGPGLTGGPITGTGSLSLALTAVSPGSYTRANFLVDAYGRLTAASNGANISLSSEVDGTLPIVSGGTGATTAHAARTSLGAAASGANNDISSLAAVDSITSLSGLNLNTSSNGNIILSPDGSGRVGVGTTSPGYTLDVNGAINASLITINGIPVGTGGGTMTGVTAGIGLTGGGTSGSVTLNVDAGTGANQIVQLNSSSQLPAVDGSLLTGVNASKLSGTAVSLTSLTIGHILKYDGTNWVNTTPTTSDLSDWASATSGFLTSSSSISGTQLPAFTGDVTSSAGSTSLTLASSGVATGIYRSVSVDSKGRVTAGTNPTTLSGYGITDAATSNNPTLTGTLTLQGATSGSVGLKAPASGASGTYTLPASISTGGYLTTDASGNLSWGTPSGATPNVSSATGVLSIANGGTGAATAAAAATNLLPAQTGNNGKFLSTDGSTLTWANQWITQGSDLYYSSGNVGIGTSSAPTQKLEVNGNVKITGELNARSESISTMNSGSGLTLSMTNGNLFKVTLNTNATITLPPEAANIPGMVQIAVVVVQDATGSRTLTWAGPAGDTIKWDGGMTPPVCSSANERTIYQFMRINGDNVWYGAQVWHECL